MENSASATSAVKMVQNTIDGLANEYNKGLDGMENALDVGMLCDALKFADTRSKMAAASAIIQNSLAPDGRLYKFCVQQNPPLHLMGLSDQIERSTEVMFEHADKMLLNVQMFVESLQNQFKFDEVMGQYFGFIESKWKEKYRPRTYDSGDDTAFPEDSTMLMGYEQRKQRERELWGREDNSQPEYFEQKIKESFLLGKFPFDKYRSCSGLEPSIMKMAPLRLMAADAIVERFPETDRPKFVEATLAYLQDPDASSNIERLREAITNIRPSNPKNWDALLAVKDAAQKKTGSSYLHTLFKRLELDPTLQIGSRQNTIDELAKEDMSFAIEHGVAGAVAKLFQNNKLDGYSEKSIEDRRIHLATKLAEVVKERGAYFDVLTDKAHRNIFEQPKYWEYKTWYKILQKNEGLLMVDKEYYQNMAYPDQSLRVQTEIATMLKEFPATYPAIFYAIKTLMERDDRDGQTGYAKSAGFTLSNKFYDDVIAQIDWNQLGIDVVSSYEVTSDKNLKKVQRLIKRTMYIMRDLGIFRRAGTKRTSFEFQPYASGMIREEVLPFVLKMYFQLGDNDKSKWLRETWNKVNTIVDTYPEEKEWNRVYAKLDWARAIRCWGDDPKRGGALLEVVATSWEDVLELKKTKADSQFGRFNVGQQVFWWDAYNRRFESGQSRGYDSGNDMFVIIPDGSGIQHGIPASRVVSSPSDTPPPYGTTDWDD